MTYGSDLEIFGRLKSYIQRIKYEGELMVENSICVT